MVLYYKRVTFMAYFLKKTNNKKVLIFRFIQAFTILNAGILPTRLINLLVMFMSFRQRALTMPISFYKEEVIRLNQEANAAKAAKKAKQISDDSPEKLIGYFPMKNINDKLSVKKYIDLMQTATDFRFNVFDMISALVYARLVQPCSKSKTYAK